MVLSLDSKYLAFGSRERIGVKTTFYASCPTLLISISLTSTYFRALETWQVTSPRTFKKFTVDIDVQESEVDFRHRKAQASGPSFRRVGMNSPILRTVTMQF